MRVGCGWDVDRVLMGCGWDVDGIKAGFRWNVGRVWVGCGCAARDNTRARPDRVPNRRSAGVPVISHVLKKKQ